MSHSARPDRFRLSPRVPASALALLLFLAPIAAANVAPEAMVYFNIRPLGSPDLLCQTGIQSCSEMEASTPAEGLLEFQLFIDPVRILHGTTPVTRFVAELDWPDAWSLVDGSFCRQASWWLFDWWGPGPHYLEVSWPCVPSDGMFLAMTLVFDVRGYGRFGPVGACELTLGCPPGDFVLYPTAQYAEAGTICEYTDQPCATWEFRCEPRWAGTGLEMQGPAGGSAHAEMGFAVGSDMYPPCQGVHARSDTPWLVPRVDSGEDPWHFVLVLDADLTEVDPGSYEAEVKVEHDEWVARCLPVTVEVGGPEGIDRPAAEPGSGGPLLLCAPTPNPGAGPFVIQWRGLWGGAVRCGIFDAAGREVRRLQAHGGSGPAWTAVWDARDAGGEPVRPGVYLVRLVAGRVRQSSRVVVVR